MKQEKQFYNIYNKYLNPNITDFCFTFILTHSGWGLHFANPSIHISTNLWYLAVMAAPGLMHDILCTIGEKRKVFTKGKYFNYFWAWT